MRRELDRGLTVEERANLRAIWENTVFNGKVLTIKHPVQTSTQDRGNLLGWMSFGSDLLTTLAFLYTGAQLGLDRRYLTIADRMYFWLRPMLLCVDTAFALGRVYAAAWYDEHSQMLINCVGNTFEPRVFESSIRFLRNRYPNNPDIQGLYARHQDARSGEYCRAVKESLTRARMFLNDYRVREVGTVAPPADWVVNHYSIRNLFEFKNPTKPLSKYVLPSRYRFSKYLWQENDVLPTLGDKAGLYIDYVFLRSLCGK